MTSSASSVSTALTRYLAGSLPAEGLAAVVAEAYYGAPGQTGARVALRPVIDVIERAAPGSVELARREDAAGFEVRPAGRPFPQAFEAELRRAVESALAASAPGAPPGVWARLVAAVRRAFSASA